MTEPMLQRIEALKRVVLDESLPAVERVAAADEVMMWAGPILTRASLGNHLGYTAGCLHDPDFECRCEAWESLARLARTEREVWPDAMDWSPE